MMQYIIETVTVLVPLSSS